MTYMNIPYGLGERSAVPLCRLLSVWQVQADDTYQVNKGEGFAAPGIFITYEGKGSLTQAGARYELYQDTYFIVQKGIPCSYQCQDNDWKFYFLDFNSLDMIRFLRLSEGETAASEKTAEAVQLCEKLIDNMIVQPLGYAYTANLLLQEMLLLFARERSASEADRHTELDPVLYAMHKNINKPLVIDELVRISGLSRSAFFARFRSATGQSPGAYMVNLKLESAKASLETTSLSVKEIAAGLHFYDEFHFSKLFKKYCGLTPSEYRRQNSVT
ncbi:AraC family transcriptional regulator [Paenibacillus sp. N4]|uniref:AraC family transcriptional regulator n=1 Tax=Paenibacillus vietnamensis TaxID=2590547 RepID=UPI001CD088AF|nr:AraC family transcriptional regulator [Paenibacillus vietnamensis]MCA0756442.1 AraC family transcriptional regulator [Paenibacillus vietnamensis]